MSPNWDIAAPAACQSHFEQAFGSYDQAKRSNRDRVARLDSRRKKSLPPWKYLPGRLNFRIRIKCH